jgi:hypothetical protein
VGARARAFPGHGYRRRDHRDDHAFCELIRTLLAAHGELSPE